jgi:uncharacterized protein
VKGQFAVGGVVFDVRLTFLIVVGTILPMIDFYGYGSTGVKAYDRLVLYWLIPVLIIVLLFREPLSTYGFQMGDWRTGLKWTVVACVIMAIILWFLARLPGMQTFYGARAQGSTLYIMYIVGLDLFSWEFIWRGLMLFGMARILGPGAAIFLQAVPFAFMHLGKPDIETLSTIFGGAGFGYVAWQSRSFVYPFIIHWFIATFTMLVASGRI